MESAQLWHQYKQHGDPAAREEIILRHAHLVRRAAEHVVLGDGFDCSSEEIINCAIAGLISAVEQYDPRWGTRFEPFASASILQFIRGATQGVRLQPPAPALENNDLKTLSQAVSPDSSLFTGYPALAVESAGRSEHPAEAHISAPAVSGHEEGTCLQDPTGSPATANPITPQESSSPPAAAAQESNDQREILIRAIGSLPPEERLVLSLYYFEELTLKEISHVLVLAESRVAQLHTRALMRLRAHLRAQADVFAAA